MRIPVYIRKVFTLLFLIFFSKLNPFFSYFIYRKYKIDSKLIEIPENSKKIYFIVHRWYYRWLRKFPDLINPNCLNDAIQLSKILYRHPLATLLSDKILSNSA